MIKYVNKIISHKGDCSTCKYEKRIAIATPCNTCFEGQSNNYTAKKKIKVIILEDDKIY